MDGLDRRGNEPLLPVAPPTTFQIDLAVGGRFQTHTASLPEGCFASEAVFVPRSPPTTGEEDDGYLLFYTYNSLRGASDLVVLDARDLERCVFMYEGSV